MPVRLWESGKTLRAVAAVIGGHGVRTSLEARPASCNTVRLGTLTMTILWVGNCMEGWMVVGPTPGRCARPRDSVLWEQRCGAVTRREADEMRGRGLDSAWGLIRSAGLDPPFTIQAAVRHHGRRLPSLPL